MVKKRSRRACKKKVSVDPCHYLGYVEDYETPEAIAMKFAAMEALAAQKRKQEEDKKAREAAKKRKRDAKASSRSPSLTPAASPSPPEDVTASLSAQVPTSTPSPQTPIGQPSSASSTTSSTSSSYSTSSHQLPQQQPHNSSRDDAALGSINGASSGAKNSAEPPAHVKPSKMEVSDDDYPMKSSKMEVFDEDEDDDDGITVPSRRSPPVDVEFSANDLQELFKMTSVFTPDSLKKQEELLAKQQHEQRKKLTKIFGKRNITRSGQSDFYLDDQGFITPLCDDWGAGYMMGNCGEIDYGELVDETMLEWEHQQDAELSGRDDFCNDVPLYELEENDSDGGNSEDDEINAEIDSDDMLDDVDDNAHARKEKRLEAELGFSDEEDYNEPERLRTRRPRGPRKVNRTVGPRKARGRKRRAPVSSYDAKGRTIGPTMSRKGKRLRSVDPRQPSFTKIPYPIPLPWALKIAPFEEFVPFEERPIPKHSKYIETEVLGHNLLDFVGGDVQGILINPPWRIPHMPKVPGQIEPEDLRRLKIPHELAPNTLIFIWVEKEYTRKVCTIMKDFNFRYAETMVYVRKRINNRFASDPSPVLNRSKCTLLMFRKKHDPRSGLTYKDSSKNRLELRHQRTCDVHFDFIRVDEENGEERKPEDITFGMIETLLPTATFFDQLKHPKLLELWGRKHERRAGWATVYQPRPNLL